MVALKNILTLIVVGILAGAVLPGYVEGQPTGDISVRDIVTEDFFNGILSQQASGGDCPAKGFYTLDAFLNALNSYTDFGQTGSADFSKREIAAFFAHATHETGYFCKTDEDLDPSNTYCDPSYTQYPCNPDKHYYGRGALQLTWNYNYGAAGTSLQFDGLNSPEIVATDVDIAFKTALWFWTTNNIRSKLSQGFGETIRTINSGECNGQKPEQVDARKNLYVNYCGQFNVDPGDNLSC